MTTVAEYADRIMKMIDEDIEAGLVPGNVRSYTDLHDYVDANDYTGDAGVPWGTDVATEADPAGVALTTDVQDEVTRRLNAPGRRFCTFGECDYSKHDHTTTQGPDGSELDEPAAMVCSHCKQPSHYDYGVDAYRHDDPAAPGCFLIPAEVA